MKFQSQPMVARLSIFVGAVVWQLGALVCYPQGTTFLSNLGETGVGFSIGGHQPFRTGAASGGYTLDSVNLLMGEWLGNASNFTVSIYSDSNGQPGGLLTTLTGNNDPQTAGLYIYSASGFNTDPLTTYWLVDSFAQSHPLGGYAWQFTSSQNYFSAGGWSTSPSANSSSDFLQFSLHATPVPEPSVIALGFLGMFVLRVVFRKP